MTLFKRFCSLGWNCEPGLALRRLGYPECADYFKWSAINFEAMLDIIQADFVDAFNENNLETVGVMVRDKKYGVATHKPSKKQFLLDGPDFTEADLFKYIEKDKKYRGSIFLGELKASDPLVYIVAYTRDSGREDAARLRKILLEKGGNPKSVILFVQEAHAEEEAWGVDGVDNCYVTKFAPYTDAESLDVEQWRSLLDRYKVMNR